MRYIHYTVFVLFFFVVSDMYGQVYLKEDSNKRMKPDSLFEEFAYPGLPPVLHSELIDFVYYGKYYIIDIYVSVYITTGKKNEIKSIIINPLYNIGNSIPKEDKFWIMLEDSIRTAVKKWKPRTWFYPDGHNPDNPYINKKSEFRPYRGYQFHFITLSWNFDSHFSPMPGLTYWLNMPEGTIPPGPEEK
jgi:hypothetical protein